MPTRSGWNTPITWFFAPAGLVRGPRMLKRVRTPSSLRTGAACFIAEWCAGANMKPIPSLSIAWPVCCGVSPMWAPSDSSSSALPEEDDTERPMCFATLAPAAAATKAAQVEMLKVCAPSPPVPQVSTRWRSSFTSTCVASSRITCAAAAISPMVSFFTRRPTMKPAICAGVSSPRMIWRMMCSISSWNTSRCSTVRWMASAAVICFMSAPVSFSLDEILQHFVPVLGEQGLGVELHPLHRQAAMAQPHDLAVLCVRRHVEAGGQAGALDHQGVIPRGDEAVGDFVKNPLAVVADAGSLAVHHLARAHHPAAEGLADRLVAEAYAQQRHPAGQPPDQLERDAGLVRRARPRRNDDVRRLQGLDCLDRDLVVPVDRHVRAELAEVLHQVVGERIVVVEHDDHA